MTKIDFFSQELVKPVLSDPSHPRFPVCLPVLQRCFLSGILMLHPVMPFLTEELYQRLPRLEGERRRDSIMEEEYPTEEEVAEGFSFKKMNITLTRFRCLSC